MCQTPYITEIDKNFLFWDQEPLHLDIHEHTVSAFKQAFQSKKTVFVTSEFKSQPVIEICDKYDMKPAYYFFHAWAALDWYRGYNRTFLSRPFKQRSFDRTFLCPNNIIGGRRKHRLQLLNELVDRDLHIENFISFPAKCPHEGKTVAQLCHEYDIHLGSVELPLIIDRSQNFAGNSHQIDLWDYADRSLLQIVTETLYDGTRLHLTEKSFKPIVMQQPFVLVSNKGSLEYLRRYGFKTFGDFWNEDYDEQDDDLRVMHIGKLLADIHNLSFKEKQHLQKHLAPAVEHNYSWFYSKEFENLLWGELQEMIAKW